MITATPEEYYGYATAEVTSKSLTQHLYNVPYRTEGPAIYLSRLITLVTLHHGVDIFHIRIDSLLDMDLPFLAPIFLKRSPSLDSLNALFTSIYSTQYCFWTK